MNPQEQINKLTKRIELLEKGKDLSRSSDNEILNLYNKNLFDYFWRAIFFYQTFFESVNTTNSGFYIGGTAGYSVSQSTSAANVVEIKTGTTNTNEVLFAKYPNACGLAYFATKSNFRTAIAFQSLTNQTVYIICGNPSADYYGFKIEDNIIYGVTEDAATENAVQLMTLTKDSTEWAYGLEARYSPEEKAIFYIDSIAYGTSTTHLPRAEMVLGPNNYLFTIYVKTKENAAKGVLISFWEYLQFRNILRA